MLAIRHINPLRTFTTSSILAATRAVSPAVKEKQKLRAQLKKEEATLSKLQSKLKEATAKHNKAAKEKEKKALQQALKPFRRLNTYSYFIKTQKGTTLLEARNKWHQLSTTEKSDLEKQTQAYNDERAKLFPPKPKKPVNGFAAFVQQNYTPTDTPVHETMKEFGKRWGGLTTEEKAQYTVAKETQDKYKKDLEAWKKLRIQNYHSS